MRTLDNSLAEIDRAIASFDGNHIAPLKEAAAGIPPTKAILDHLIDRCDGQNEAVQIGGTWLIKHYLEKGAALTAGQNGQIARLINKVAPWQAQLHLAQSFVWLNVPGEQLTPVTQTLKSWFGSEHKFLRAWACDALWRLGRQHEQIQQMALDIVLAAEADPAASVRARARNLLKMK